MEPEARDLVQRALAEDIGAGDVTADAVVPAYARARGRIAQKQDGVVFVNGTDSWFASLGAKKKG